MTKVKRTNLWYYTIQKKTLKHLRTKDDKVMKRPEHDKLYVLKGLCIKFSKSISRVKTIH